MQRACDTFSPPPYDDRRRASFLFFGFLVVETMAFHFLIPSKLLLLSKEASGGDSFRDDPLSADFH